LADADDLATELIDLTAIPLGELNRCQDPVLAAAIRRAFDNAAHAHASAIQDQRQ
jgi:hypothetical protein